ncbi:hypothetical protein [Actinokineospora sp. NBRC 105648]|uniref:hypothetical protein n=1 Tax=Actinokineospora sp. NBRC 105648 TaxID=3032206 RepID=UPI0024A518B0|nr:hypothetical protein [Actinokineospora sp. NBRC 105648]GLZ37663.1 hypothetical protein Acsp05_12880 [Actinokineospora sp. NBRC 105648]
MSTEDEEARVVHHGDARNVVQAGRVIGNITVTTARWSTRTRLAALGAVVVLGTAAALYFALRPEPRQSVSVIAQVTSGSCAGGWVVPDTDQPVPLTGGPANRPPGAVQADKGIVVVTVQGDQEKTVVLQEMRVDVVARHPAMIGVFLPTPCGGDLTPRTFEVDLAKPAPAAVGTAGKSGGEDIPAPSFPFTVSETDPEQLEISARSTTEDVEWRLRLVWTSGDQRGESVVDDAGRPFRTTAKSAVSKDYCVDWTINAWAPRGRPTNPCPPMD